MASSKSRLDKTPSSPIYCYLCSSNRRYRRDPHPPSVARPAQPPGLRPPPAPGAVPSWPYRAPGGQFPLLITTPPTTDPAHVLPLYRHECRSRCCPPRWSEYALPDAEAAALDARAARAPIILRQTYNSDKMTWVIESFTVQDVSMRQLLSAALEGYQDLDLDSAAWTFTPPYKAIVHRWQRLTDLISEVENSGGECGGSDTEETDAGEARAMKEGTGAGTASIDKTQAGRETASALRQFLTPIVHPAVGACKEARKTGQVAWDNVWQIFPPGELVLMKIAGVQAVGRVVRQKRVGKQPGYPDPCQEITLEFVSWNGERCGYADVNRRIYRFEGLRKVVGLAVYPLSFADDPTAVETRMIQRGRKFERLRGFHFLTCDRATKLSGGLKSQISGRCVCLLRHTGLAKAPATTRWGK